MSKTILIENISTTKQQFFANTNKSIENELEKNKIPFKSAGKNICSIEIPPQSIIEVLDGETTQSELHPSVKGKVVKNANEKGKYLGNSSAKSALESEIKELEAKKNTLLSEIKELEAKK